MIEDTGIDWKKNTQEYFLNEFKQDTLRDVASAMLKEGLTLEMIERITKLPLAEIEKLQAQRV